MFNLNESNRFVLSYTSTDMRKGVDSLCGEIRKVGLDPFDKNVYIFVIQVSQVKKNSSRKGIKKA